MKTDWSVIGADRLLDEVAGRAPVMIFALDAEGVATLSTGAGMTAMGLEPGSLVGVNVLERFPARPDRARLLARLRSGERVETRVPFPDGHVLAIWLTPVMSNGHFEGIFGFGFDLSSQLEVARERRIFRDLVEASPQLIAVVGGDGHVEYMNPGGRVMIGLPEDLDVTTTRWDEYFSDAELAKIAVTETPATRSTGRYEGEGTVRDWSTGRDIPVQVTTYVIRDPATAEITGYATVRSDITEIVAARAVAEETARHRQGLLLHLHEAQETERRRIAGDIHDDTVQVLAAVNLRLQVLRRQLQTTTTSDAILPAVDVLDEAVRAAAGRLRSVLVQLDPAPPDPEALETQLQSRAEAVLADTGVAIEVEVRVDEPPQDPLGGVLLRIAQEALTNVRKHAKATSVALALTQESGSYLLRVCDDGVGVTEDRVSERHLGVRSMVERAESLGGRCSVTRGAQGGTVVEAYLPVRIGHVEDLRAVSARLVIEQTMANFSEGYLALDTNWRIVFANAAVYDQLQRDPADSLLGKYLWDEFDPEDGPEFAAAYRRARAEQQPVTVRAYFAANDRWMENRVIPTPSGISVFGRDVTEEVRLAEEADYRAFLVAAGTRVMHALASGPDTRSALQQALTEMVNGWRLTAALLHIPARDGSPAYTVEAGDTSAPGPRSSRPLEFSGRTVGEIELIGGGIPLDARLMDFFAVRVAAG